MMSENRSAAHMPTARPSVVERGAHTTDDGLFGPDSLTWRLHAQRSMMLVGSAAATTQMLNPRVMRMIDQASHFRQDPESRAKGTFQYIVTITYGDAATAKHAGDRLRSMHQAVLATDPITGETYNAEVSELLLWVHNTLTLTAVHAFQRYGGGLSPADADAYVREQVIAAELVGIDRMLVPQSVSELEEYMVQVRSTLAMIPEGLWFRDMMTSHGPGVGGLAEKFVKDAAIGLMLPEHRALFGLEFSRRRDRTAERVTKALFAMLDSKVPVARAIPELRRQVDVAAFGARRQRPAQ